MSPETLDLRACTPEALQEILQPFQQPSYRAGQLFRYLQTDPRGLDCLTTLPKSLRESLSNTYHVSQLQQLRAQVSQKDGTAKYLWGLDDGNAVETVLMHYEHGDSVCISTQVGCRQGCAFCASTLGGLVRNLTAGEMLCEVLSTAHTPQATRLRHVVLMGIGEPLDNYDEVLRFIRLITHPDGYQMSARHISLSTCGLIEGMDRLAGEDLPVTLCVSLHAPDDDTRRALMPIARTVPLSELLAACRRYKERTGRRVTFEYALIHDVNDSLTQAKQLAQIARRCGAHINLIPLNTVAGRSLQASRRQQVLAFADTLRKAGGNVTVRRRLGGDIDAACGQLRRKSAEI